jgi:hypothetical protein
LRWVFILEPFYGLGVAAEVPFGYKFLGFCFRQELIRPGHFADDNAVYVLVSNPITVV